MELLISFAHDQHLCVPSAAIVFEFYYGFSPLPSIHIPFFFQPNRDVVYVIILIALAFMVVAVKREGWGVVCFKIRLKTFSFIQQALWASTGKEVDLVMGKYWENISKPAFRRLIAYIILAIEYLL